MSNFQDQLPCPICGQTSYSCGEAQAQGLRYLADDAGFRERNFGKNFVDIRLPARQCNHCGNIQLFSQDFVGEK